MPFAAGVAWLMMVERPAIGRGSAALLDWSLLACLAGVSAQLIPLSSSLRQWLSPQASAIERALRLDPMPRTLPVHALSIDPESTAWALATGAAYIGLFWCARAAFTHGGVRMATRGVASLGLALTAFVAIQRATSPTLLYWQWRPLDAGASPYGPFVNRNGLACWLAMAVPLVIGYAAARQQSRPRDSTNVSAIDATQVWLGGAACLMTGGLIGSLSRAGMIGAAVGLVAFVAMAGTRVSRRSRLVWIAAGLAAMVGVATLYANLGALAHRAQETTELGEWGRPVIWHDTWRMVQDFPLTGVGAGAYQRGMLVYQQASRLFFFNHAHNEYLQLLVEGGLLIVVPAAVALLAAVTLLVRRLRAEHSPIFWVRAGASAGMLAAAVQSIWDTALRTPANGALFAVLAAVAMHAPRAATTHGHREHSGSR